MSFINKNINHEPFTNEPERDMNKFWQRRTLYEARCGTCCNILFMLGRLRPRAQTARWFASCQVRKSSSDQKLFNKNYFVFYLEIIWKYLTLASKNFCIHVFSIFWPVELFGADTGAALLVRFYLKATLERGSDQKRFQVTGCGASDASVVAIHTAMLHRILIN